MKSRARIIAAILLMMLFLTSGKEARSQVFWIGLNGGATHSWFSSPKANDLVVGKGWGWNLGFFVRYGKRPFYQAGIYWTRAEIDMKYHYNPHIVFEDDVPFDNFDIIVKAGYEIIHKPMFKWHINAGPFIGSSLLFSTNTFDIEIDDMRNPQFGINTGTGIQIMNLIIDVDIQHHLTELFLGDEVDLGVEFGSHMNHVTMKVGFIF
jgi:hypothetical protein